MRKVAKCSDGWYFENQKIEPTLEEVKAWNDSFCKHCMMGSIMPKDGDLSSMCERQMPCPACMGTGYKDWKGKNFLHADNATVVSISPNKLDADDLWMYRRVAVEFDWNIPVQEDGRPHKPIHRRTLLMLHIGNAVLEAVESKKDR